MNRTSSRKNTNTHHSSQQNLRSGQNQHRENLNSSVEESFNQNLDIEERKRQLLEATQREQATIQSISADLLRDLSSFKLDREFSGRWKEMPGFVETTFQDINKNIQHAAELQMIEEKLEKDIS